MTDRPLVIYHQNCADGFTAAWLAWLYFKGEADFLPAQYGDAPPDVTGREVYVLDFSWKRHETMLMIATAKKFVLCDHHKTAEAELSGLGETVGELTTNPTVVFDMAKSGAMLAWEHFYPGSPVRRLVNYVQDRDLWSWKLPWSKEVNALIASYPKTFEAWTELSNFLQLYGMTEGSSVVQQGAAILRYQERLVEGAVAHAWEQEVAGHKVLVVNVSEASLISEVSGRLAEGRPFGATFFVGADGKKTWSLRSREGGLDVSEIAKKMGGGGHKQAAGFRE